MSFVNLDIIEQETIDLDLGGIVFKGGGGGGTVDQTYNPTSTNAQSGTAVAQAVGDKADRSSVTALYNTTEQLRTDINGVSYDLAHFKNEYLIDMGGVVDRVVKLAFVATYNETTAQEIISYLESENEPFAPILVKRGNDYYTVITANKQAENKIIIRTFATLGGNYYMFTYTITDGVWANANHGFQKLLVSGVDIKTINGESVLGSGNINVQGSGSNDYNDLINKPSINGVELQGDKSTANLGVDAMSVQDIERILYLDS